MNLILRQKTKGINREQLMGTVTITCLIILILSVIIINLLDVKVSNIEQVDRGLYTIITNKGTTNISPDDVIRIERTFTKAAITGNSIELDKIYTTKGFIYVSSPDPFASEGRQLINSVDYEGKTIWERQKENWKSVQPFAYAIGTPVKQIPILFFSLNLQYFILSIGGIALAILIFPHRLRDNSYLSIQNLNEQEFHQEEKTFGAVAK